MVYEVAALSVQQALMEGLNPCSNGRWSMSRANKLYAHLAECLNPCSNGRWSMSCTWQIACEHALRCLNPCSNGRWSMRASSHTVPKFPQSLNPCSNGRWSMSWAHLRADDPPAYVLILVLMADGLWVSVLLQGGTYLASLNPCSNGRWSMRSTAMTRSLSRLLSLNPCSNGRWSMSRRSSAGDSLCGLS